MMYILTQEEFDELKQKAATPKPWRPDITTKQLQKLCTKICDEMPVVWGWTGPGPDPKPWGCKITKERGDAGYEWYCDKCPVELLCPHNEKDFSK